MAVHRLYIVERNQPGSTPLWEAENDQEVFIGRGEYCNISVPIGLQSVSRQHARLSIKDNQCLLEDISTNGTAVNNHQMLRGRPQVLQNGDQINLADSYYFLYRKEDNDAATAPTITARLPRALLEISLYQKQIEQVFKACRNAQSVLLLGMPHMGKTTFLLALQRKAIQEHYFPEATESLIVYCDMQPLSSQSEASGISNNAFFGLLADYLLTHLHGLAITPDEGALNRLRTFRERLATQQDFLLDSEFRQILDLIYRTTGLGKIILLLDHFEEASRRLDANLWGRLVKLKRSLDQIHLSFVIGMRRPLTAIHPGSAPHTNFETSLQRIILPPPDLEVGFYWSNRLDFVNDTATANVIIINLFRWSMGHPELMEMAIAYLRQEIAFPLTKAGLPEPLYQQLNQSELVRITCQAIWEGLSVEEQAALIAFLRGDKLTEKVRRELLELHLLVKQDKLGGAVATLAIFAEPFEHYLREVSGLGTQPSLKKAQASNHPTVGTDKLSLNDATQGLVTLPPAPPDLSKVYIRVLEGQHQIMVNDKVIELGDKGGIMKREFDVLVLLYNNKGYTVPEDRIGDELFKPDIDWERETLHRSINRLNEKLTKLSGIEYKFIHRVRTIGYRLSKAK